MVRAAMLAATVLMCGAAAAQTENHFRAEADPGKPVRIGIYSVVKKDCTLGPLPEFRVLEAPKYGMLTVRRGARKLSQATPCPDLTLPAILVYYRARVNYAGPDTVKYEVKSPGGQTETNTVNITVKEGEGTRPSPSPSPAPSPSPGPGPRAPLLDQSGRLGRG